MNKMMIYMVIGLTIGMIVSKVYSDSKLLNYKSRITVFKKEQAIRDSVIAVLDSAISQLQTERISLRSKKDSVETVLDSTLIRMEELTKQEVTTATINEGRLWIEEHNRSLGE